MINTPEYGLAKWLDSLIKPYIPTQHTVDSTKQFIRRLKDHTFTGSEVLCSFDVVSLFTNVPLKETIKIIADYIFDAVGDRLPFSKQVFINMLEKACCGIFLY